MRKQIFIGSSSEFRALAVSLAESIGADSEVRPRVWSDEFPAGYLTLESIECAMHTACAAVFIATPDDRARLRKKKVQIPRANVLFELGLFSARLGRANVALCLFDEVELPTDLKGYTHIPMGAAPSTEEEKAAWRIDERAQDLLSAWLARVGLRVQSFPKTALLHGYSGRWDVMMDFTRWRNADVGPGSSVRIHGYVDLIVPCDGTNGIGIAHGTISAHLKSAPTSGREDYAAEINVVDRVLNARCKTNGGLTFVSETFSRLVAAPAVQREDIEASAPILHGPKRFVWDLDPCADDLVSLKGGYRIENDDRDNATVKMWRPACDGDTVHLLESERRWSKMHAPMK